MNTREVQVKLSIMAKDARHEAIWPELLPLLEEYKKEHYNEIKLYKQERKVSNKPKIDIAELAAKRKRCGELKQAGLPCNEFNQNKIENKGV